VSEGESLEGDENDQGEVSSEEEEASQGQEEESESDANDLLVPAAKQRKVSLDEEEL
jgi:hypothetical protein